MCLFAGSQSLLNEGTAEPGRLLHHNTAAPNQRCQAPRGFLRSTKAQKLGYRYQIGMFQLYCRSSCTSHAGESTHPVTAVEVYTRQKLKPQHSGNSSFVLRSQGCLPRGFRHLPHLSRLAGNFLTTDKGSWGCAASVPSVGGKQKVPPAGVSGCAFPKFSRFVLETLPGAGGEAMPAAGALSSPAIYWAGMVGVWGGRETGREGEGRCFPSGLPRTRVG